MLMPLIQGSNEPMYNQGIVVVFEQSIIKKHKENGYHIIHKLLKPF